MRTEQLIEQIAELRAAVAVQMWMMTEFLENMGANPRRLIEAIDGMSNTFADGFENQMRKAAGLDKREKPRTKQDPVDIISKIDWSKMREN